MSQRIFAAPVLMQGLASAVSLMCRPLQWQNWIYGDCVCWEHTSLWKKKKRTLLM